MYKVIKRFHDLQDVTKTENGGVYHEYKAGDIFPRDGREASEERIAELAGKDNKQRVPLIMWTEEKKEPEEPEDPSGAAPKEPKKKTVKKTGSE